MAQPAHRRATYQDVIDAPEGVIAEIIAGELHLTPRPAMPHASASSAAGGELWNLFGRRRSGDGRPGGWVILDEPELHLGQPDPRSEVLVPDLAGWRRSRLAETPRGAALELAPDWACEILSPGSRNIRHDRLVKADAYHRADVGWFWIVDPLARLVEVYRHTPEGYLRVRAVGGPVLARLEPFEAAELDLSEWWLPEDDGEASGTT